VIWRCPVHREDMEQCAHRCEWWKDQWFLTIHAFQSYWHHRRLGIRPLVRKRRDKFTQRWHAVLEIVERAAA
jgi:hypothetical protein